MLNKLRNRFIFINMLLVGIVLFALFTVVLAISVVSNYTDLIEAMDEALEREIDVPFVNPFIGDYDHTNRDDEDRSREVYVVSVMPTTDLTGSGYWVERSVNNYVTMSDDALREAVERVMEAGTVEGWLDDMSLIYRTQAYYTATKIAFADTTEFISSTKNGFINLTSICTIVFVAFFFISNFLASMAFKPAEKAWEQQQHFLADASHELKTPLTVILANNNILGSHEEKTIEEMRKWVDSTQAEAEHMKRLVDELLFLAKSDAAKSEIPKEPVDLSELAWSNYLQFEPVAFERSVLMDAEIQNEITVSGDRTQLNQLVHILLDNAIKYAGDGGSVDWKLEKYTTGKTKLQNYARLCVHNTGKPIPAEDLPHIYERFYRSDRARSAGSGYGLGLAIAKSICEVHEADIFAESAQEKGTTFTVRFKL